MAKAPKKHKPPGISETKRIDNRNQNSAARGYDRRWRKARLNYLAKHPVCVSCGYGATVVDHIVPHRGDKQLFWDVSNWQALCERCHNRKTASGQ